MATLKSIGKTLVLLFVSLVLGINVYLWNARSLMGNALPMPFGFGAAVVLTGSMEPAIMADDLILVARAETYAVDEIVVYQSGGLLIVHRIVDLADGLVTTRGDANNAPDAPVELSRIKGKVIACIPGAGGLVRLLKTPAATIALVLGAVAMMEASYRKEKKKGDDELEKLKEEIRRLKAEQE